MMRNWRRQRVKVDQLKALYALKKSQFDQLKVRAGFDRSMLEIMLDAGGAGPEGVGGDGARQGPRSPPT